MVGNSVSENLPGLSSYAISVYLCLRREAVEQYKKKLDKTSRKAFTLFNSQIENLFPRLSPEDRETVEKRLREPKSTQTPKIPYK